MQIFNTLTGRVEPIVPIEPGRIRIYSCGPTVYRYIHIGNLRTFVMADWLRRALAYAGYEVFHVKNITDVGHMRMELLDRGEDKLIAQARSEGKSALEIAAFYTAAFRADEAALNILPAHVFPRATDHIPEMIAIVEGLLREGLAYVAGGNVYFDIARFPAYGALSGNQIAHLLEGVRAAGDLARRNPEDFALWKAAEPGREMAWDSPWGRGFPGWHIECSAMAMKYLGPHFDIHTGGVDNIFPHHEDEIAQSEGYTGQRFVNTWVHAQHLLVDGLKMAKSTGNVYTRADVEARGFEPLALRYLFTTARYRTRLNFTFQALRAAQTALDRLRAAAARLAEEAAGQGFAGQSVNQLSYAMNAAGSTEPSGPSWRLAGATGSPRGGASLRAQEWQRRFAAAIEDDLNLPRAMDVVWSMIHDRDRAPGLRLALLLDFEQVLGLGLEEWLQGSEQRGSARDLRNAPSEVMSLLAQRESLRREGRYVEADALRERVAAAGYAVRDTPAGPLLARAPREQPETIARSDDVADQSGAPDLYDISVNLLTRDSRPDLERCIASIARHSAGHRLEFVIVDNGSTDDTVAYLQELAGAGVQDADGHSIPLHILFADHNLGFASGRNATMRASRGRAIVLLDTAIEVRGEIWRPLMQALADEQIGVAGPYGLVTGDLREFYESPGPDVDAVEGYLIAFRRALLPEVGWAEEKFRFYRLLDIHLSFAFKAAGYRVVALPEVAALLERHPHREWHSLTEEERATRSKKNYDIFKRRWHHGQSLLVANATPGSRWFGHDHPHHLGPCHTHAPEDLPLPNQPHTHVHQHWPDHAHEHPHTHQVPDS